MVDLSKLFDLPIIRCHHKESLCRFALHDPHYTFFVDGHRRDLWVTRCFVGREYCDCEDYRSVPESNCTVSTERLLSEEREGSSDEGRGSNLLWNEAGGCKWVHYRAGRRNLSEVPNG